MMAMGTGGAGQGGAGTGGQTPTGLSSILTTHNFGNVEVGVNSTSIVWTVANSGNVATGTLTLTNGNPTEAIVTNGCTASLAAGGMCTISVVFKASAAGARTATLTLGSSSAGMLTLSLMARGQYRLTVVTAGTGTVTSTPTAINCGATCSVLVDPGAVTLRARTTNGSGAFFSAWSGGGCQGPLRDCALNISAPVTVTATFTPMMANLIFMTAATFPANLGGTAPYDVKCNQAATAAGINNIAGTGYIAFMNDASSLAKNRLGTARGWVRMDGAPFADTQATLFDDRRVFNSIRFDESGSKLHQTRAFTGAGPSGDLSDNCSGWTTNASGSTEANYSSFGASDGGPNAWMTGGSNSCSFDRSLICLGKTNIAVVGPAVHTGKTIWHSSGYAFGTQTPDAKCQAERPMGVANGVAFVSYTNRAASAVLTPTAVYVRPDGTRVGTGAQLAAGGELDSGIWQNALGAYSSFELCWTGSPKPNEVGSDVSTCENWSSQVPSGNTVGSSYVDSGFWWNVIARTCNLTISLYCVEP